jgi:ketosteroid isomerase-like protein
MSFHAGLAEHLAAISARDIDRFAATVSDDPEARVVAPDGGVVARRHAIVAAHRDWFATGGWTFAPQILFERTSDALGFALLDVAYREAGKQSRFLLSVVFVREDGVWRLLYDQNTPLG